MNTKRLSTGIFTLLLFGVGALGWVEYYAVGFADFSFLAVILFIGAVRIALFMMGSKTSELEGEDLYETGRIIQRANWLIVGFVVYLLIAFFMPETYNFTKDVWEQVKDAEGNLITNQWGGIKKEKTGVEILYSLKRTQVSGFLLICIGLFSSLYLDKSWATLQSMIGAEKSDCAEYQQALEESEKKIEELSQSNLELTERINNLMVENEEAQELRVLNSANEHIIHDLQTALRENSFKMNELQEEKDFLQKNGDGATKMFWEFWEKYIEGRQFKDKDEGQFDMKSKRAYTYSIDKDNWEIVRTEVKKNGAN